MAEKINKLVIEIDGKDYEFSGGGEQPAADSVGTEQIADNSVMMDDLNSEVKAKMTNTYDEGDESLTLGN